MSLNIIDLIPFGKENAVSRSYLCMATGMTDRQMREAIGKARLGTVILSRDDGKGYYRPTEEESIEIMQYYLRERARSKSIEDGLKPVRESLGI